MSGVRMVWMVDCASHVQEEGEAQGQENCRQLRDGRRNDVYRSRAGFPVPDLICGDGVYNGSKRPRFNTVAEIVAFLCLFNLLPHAPYTTLHGVYWHDHCLRYLD
mgnify:CR=1 FL=1